MKFYKKLRFVIDDNIRSLIYFLIFGLILMSILEFISLGSIPLLVGYLIEPKQMSVFFEKYFNISFNLNLDLKLFSIIIFLIFLSKSLLLSMINYFELKTIKDLKISITNNLFKKYLDNNYKFFIDNNHSVLSRNLIKEVDNAVGLIQSVIFLIREFFLLSMIFFLLFIYNPILSLAILGILIFSAIVFYVGTDKLLKSFAIERINLTGKIFNLVPQVFNLIKEIKILRKEKYFIDFFSRIKSDFEKKIIIVDFFKRLPKILFEFLAITILLIIIVFLGIDNKNQLSNALPFLTLVTICTVKLIPSFNTISGALTHIQSYTNSFNLIFDELNNNQNIDKKFLQTADHQDKIISFVDVNFHYKSSNKVSLTNINFDIKRGEMIGIIGKSGSGKTTLVNLLMGLLRPSSGIVNFYFKKKEYILGLVPQDIIIFDDSLKKNIALGEYDDEIDEKKIKEVIEMSGLSNFFQKNQNNINLSLSDKGINISGGEKQRIGIARSLYNEPELLILDEATSSLDIKTEKIFLSHIEKLKGKITTIFVSHRISALDKCDSVYLIDKGKIVSKGSTEFILNKYPSLTVD